MTNLYKLLFTHYSPKDSETGIHTYMVAETDSDIHDYMDKEYNCECWADKDNEECEEIANGGAEYANYNIYDDEYNIIGTKSFRKRNIEMCGQMFDEDYDLCDLYYGVTLHGWELVQENVDIAAIQGAINLGIIEYGNESN